LIEAKLKVKASQKYLEKIKKLVPRLDLSILPEYVSTDEEEGDALDE